MMFNQQYTATILTLIAFFSLTTPAWAVDELAYLPTSPAALANSVSPFVVQLRKTRPTIALALGGGGIRGAAHIGVLRVLERENFPVDFIAGSSMGAIVGGMYAAGVHPESLAEMFRNRSLFKAYTPVSDTLKLMTIPASMLVRTAKKAVGINTKMIGLHSSNGIASFVDKHVSLYRRNIEHSEIPFVAVATNLIDGKPYAIEYGNLGRAVQASSAIPFYIKPVLIDGKYFVDGALRANVPTLQARESGADIVISVNVDEDLQTMSPATLTRVTPYGNRVLSIILNELDGHHTGFADIEIRPDLSPMPIYSRRVDDAERAMRAGEAAAERALPQIKMLLNSKLAMHKDPT